MRLFRPGCMPEEVAHKVARAISLPICLKNSLKSNPRAGPTRSQVMSAFPTAYRTVFRPPSEAQFADLAGTTAVPGTTALFCEMYTAPQKEISAHGRRSGCEEFRRAVSS